VLELVAGEGGSALRARVLIAQSGIAANRDNLKESIELARQAVADADASGNMHIGLSARMDLAASLQDAGEAEEGGRTYLETLPRARAQGNEAFVGVILQNLAIYWLNKGDVARARENSAESLAIEERINDEYDRPWSLDELATDEIEGNEPGPAKTHAEQALALREKLHMPADPSRKILARALLDLKDLDGALREATATYESAKAAGSDLRLGDTAMALIEVHIARHEPKAALALIDEGEASAKRLGSDSSYFAEARAQTLLLLGRLADAQRLVAQPASNVMQERFRRLVRAQLLIRTGRRSEALAGLQALASEAHAAGHFRVEREANGLIGGGEVR
jgi:hypothetical protein